VTIRLLVASSLCPLLAVMAGSASPKKILFARIYVVAQPYDIDGGNWMSWQITIGEILVEIIATDKGDEFLEPVKLVGPSRLAHRRFSSIRPLRLVSRPRSSDAWGR
jgi:hypothetical protein